MFDNIIRQIDEWIKSLLRGMIEVNLGKMFDSVNTSVTEIGIDVAKTPQN